jgi:hypothetical protein
MMKYIFTIGYWHTSCSRYEIGGIQHVQKKFSDVVKGLEASCECASRNCPLWASLIYVSGYLVVESGLE